MIEIADKEKCCGCGACAQACPARCIAMREDGEGFVYPEADAGRCIGCGLCERVCPALNQGEPSRSPAPFAVRATSDGLRMQGSSGGVFPVLARMQRSSDELLLHAIDCAKQIDAVVNGDTVVIAAGIPLNTTGSTNLMRVAIVGKD